MGKHIAAFYSPDNNLEHALQLRFPNGPSNRPVLSDITFSPQTQGRVRLVHSNLFPGAVALSGAYSPVDGLRYAFYATPDNQVYVSTYPQEGYDIFDFPAAHVYDTPFPNYPPNSIVDIAAFFSLDPNPAVSDQIYVAVLMANGDIWEIFGTHDTIGSWTAIGLLFAHAPHGKSICAYYSPQDQQRHLLVATDHDITHVYTTSHSTQQETFAHFDEMIIAISGFYTPDDQMQHAIVATTDGTAYHVQETVFQLGTQTPPARLLGTVNFPFVDIGAYVNPDGGRHVAMLGPTGNPYPNDTQLYLSWYYPGWQGFAFGPWPTLKLWPILPATIESFTAQPNQIHAGDTATLSWQIGIHRYEGAQAYNFHIDGQDASGMRVFHYGFLDFTGSKAVQPMSTTVYTLTALVEGDDPAFVSSSQQLQVTVIPRPPTMPADLVVTSTYYTDESGNALPHLYENDPFVAHFIVGNAGGMATGSFNVTMVIDDSAQSSITVPATNLAPGQSTDVSWNFSGGLPSGSYEIVATVDPEGVVKEPPGPRVSTLGIIIDSH